jgi:hypothetical protein
MSERALEAAPGWQFIPALVFSYIQGSSAVGP